MSFLSSPGVPAYRITLFYGPEYVEGQPKIIQCVFNVKKRSWKGGVQIVVDLEEEQFTRVGKSLHFDAWVEDILTQVPENSRTQCAERAKDLFAQQVCLTKLQQAIQQGIRQENFRLESQMFVPELDEAMVREAPSIKNQMLDELDVENIVSQEFS